MSSLLFQKKTYALEAGETVLLGLERHGVTIPSGCRAGICHSCLMMAVDGPPPTSAQRGLSPAQCDRDEFLACLCIPERDMHVAAVEAKQHQKATIVEKSWLGPRILRLRLEAVGDYRYRPGQFLNLVRADGLTRSYSIASVPGDDNIVELQIAHVPEGRMSGWLADEAQSGDALEISPALGECYYREGNEGQSLVLIGTGSGLAPLYGIARDALRRGHRGDIHLYHGSSNANGLYLVRELTELAAGYANFRYIPCVSRDVAAAPLRAGRAHRVALEDLPQLKGARVFLCGHPEMVKEAQRAVFLAGVSMSDIHVDAFVSSPGPR